MDVTNVEQLVNCTGRPIKVYSDASVIYFNVERFAANIVTHTTPNGILKTKENYFKVSTLVSHEIISLPIESEGTLYIVNEDVFNCSSRKDIIMPDYLDLNVVSRSSLIFSDSKLNSEVIYAVGFIIKPQ